MPFQENMINNHQIPVRILLEGPFLEGGSGSPGCVLEHTSRTHLKNFAPFCCMYAILSNSSTTWSP